MTTQLRVSAAVLITMATVLVLVLSPGLWSATLASTFGPLRAPGEAAFIAAHRGDRSTAPENTIPAFLAAVASGSDSLETDVRLTADGIPVLMHDPEVDRTTNGSGLVADLTFAELRGLDAGEWFDPSFAGTQVPTLDEFLDVVATEDVTALIELKDTWDVAQIAPLVSSVYFRGLQDRIVFASFSAPTLLALREAAPAIPTVLIRRDVPIDPVEVTQRYGASALMTRVSALEARPETVQRMHEAGLGVTAYTLNSEDGWGAALGFGVDGIITDEPSALDAWIAATAPGT